MIRIIAGGKKSKNWVLDGISEYEKRLKKPYDLKFEYFEEEKLAKLLEFWPFSAQEYVILLDERGENISSPELNRRLQRCFVTGLKPVIIIGGAYGVSEKVRRRANFVWSVSNLVFPHELIRVMLSEQIYRAQEIARGSNYHHA